MEEMKVLYTPKISQKRHGLKEKDNLESRSFDQ